MKNGLVLMYVEDSILYPVVLNKEQEKVFNIVPSIIPKPINYLKNNPLGVIASVGKKVKD